MQRPGPDRNIPQLLILSVRVGGGMCSASTASAPSPGPFSAVLFQPGQRSASVV